MDGDTGMKKLTILLFILLLVLSTCYFTACDDDIQQGYVVAKELKPAERTMFVTYSYIYSGKMMIPVPHYWYYSRPDRWSLTSEDGYIFNRPRKQFEVNIVKYALVLPNENERF